MGIVEKDYFGLQFVDKASDCKIWINNRLQVRNQVKTKPPYQLNFTVKYYTDPEMLLQPSTMWVYNTTWKPNFGELVLFSGLTFNNVRLAFGARNYPVLCCCLTKNCIDSARKSETPPYPHMDGCISQLGLVIFVLKFLPADFIVCKTTKIWHAHLLLAVLHSSRHLDTKSSKGRSTFLTERRVWLGHTLPRLKLETTRRASITHQVLCTLSTFLSGLAVLHT